MNTSIKLNTGRVTGGGQNMNRGNVFGINGKIETECLTVVGAQYAPIGAMNMEDVDRNTETLLSFMDRASGGFPGFDLFVAPEACIQGFPQFGWENALLTMDSPQIKKFQEKCAELEVYGVFDFLLRVDEQNNYTNTAIVINDKGEMNIYAHSTRKAKRDSARLLDKVASNA